MHIRILNKKTRKVCLSLFIYSFLLAAVILSAPVVSSAAVDVVVSVAFAPPAIPIYAQPLCPGPGYIWVPGYWAWDPVVYYYWVPGIWVVAPFVGALWTPGYWAWRDEVYVWYEGYWGPVVGFYGGINYGFGYTAAGYFGGYWKGNIFYYNRTVNNITNNITTIYNQPVSGAGATRAGFNGGTGGTTARATSEQLAAANKKRLALTDTQKQQIRAARDDPKQRATVNRGRPAVAATTKPGVFTGSGVTRASRAGATYKAPKETGKAVTEKSVKTPKGGAEKSPRAVKPERAAPKPLLKERQPRLREPGPTHIKPETGPEMKPSQPQEKGDGGKGGGGKGGGGKD